MATVRDAIKARLSRLKDDVLNSTFIKGNVPSREQQLQRVNTGGYKPPELNLSNLWQRTKQSYTLPFQTTNSPSYGSLSPEQKVGTQSPKFLASMTGSGKIGEAMTSLRGVAGVGATLGLGGGINKAMGGSFREGVTSTAKNLPSIYGVTQFTNPAITNTVGRIAPRIASPVGKFVANRSLSGLANVPEGMMINSAMNTPYTGTDLAFDVGTGLALGTSGNDVRPKADLLIGKKGANNLGKPIGTMVGDFASTFDKKLKREISDSLAKVNNAEWTNIRDNLIKTKTGASFLGDLFKHDRLYKAYPEFRKLTVKLDPTYVASATYGSFNPNDYSIRVNPNLGNNQAKSTLIHEIEHAIQTVEDFAKGASYRPVSEDFINSVDRNKDELFNMLAETKDISRRRLILKNIDDLDRQMSDAKRRATRQYLTEPGEFEARAVEGRQNLTQRELTGTDPYYGQLQKEGLNPKDIKAWGGGRVNQSTDPLAQEARKYKSAEEFVKNTESTLKRIFAARGIDAGKKSFLTTDGTVVSLKGEDAHYNVFGKSSEGNNLLTKYLDNGGIRINKGDLNGKHPYVAIEINSKPTVDQTKALESLPDNLTYSFDIRGRGKTISSDIVTNTKDDFLNKLREYYPDIWNKANGEMMSRETPKTVKVWIKSKFSNEGGYADIPVIRKEENIKLYQGGNGENRQFWTPDKKYAEQFGNVTEKTGTFYKVDNGNRMTDVYVEAPQTNKSQKMMSKGVDNGVVKPQGDGIEFPTGLYKAFRDKTPKEFLDYAIQKQDFYIPRSEQELLNAIREGKGAGLIPQEQLPKQIRLKNDSGGGDIKLTPDLADYFLNGRKQPQIDRTRLTGMQLETPNAKLQSPEVIKAFGKQEGVKLQTGSPVKGQQATKLKTSVENTSRQPIRPQANSSYDKTPDLSNYDQTFSKFIANREVGKTTATQTASKYASIPRKIAKEVIDYMEGINKKASPEVQKWGKQMKAEYDRLHDVAKQSAIDAGLDVGYLENYVPHFWKESAEEVQQAFMSAKKNLPQSKERIFPTYEEGIKLGFTPKYEHPAQMMEAYVRNLEKFNASVELMKTLKANNIVVPTAGGITKGGYVPIRAQGIGGNWYAPKEIAEQINRLFSPEPQTGIGKALGKTAKLAGAVQDLTLSGGLPATPINAFTIAQVQKELLAGNLKSPFSAMWNSLSSKKSTKFFDDNAGQIKKMQSQNVPFNSEYAVDNMIDEKTATKIFGHGIGNAWGKLVNEPTFKRFMPMLQVNLFNQIEEQALKAGKSADEATRIASKAVKNFYGLKGTDITAKKSQLGKDVAGTFLFAPHYRESMINMWVNTVKAMKNPLALENRTNVKFAVGAVATYLAMNALNQQYSGHAMSENPEGKKDKLLIPLSDGYTMGVPFLSSIATMPRLAYSMAEKAVKGDITGTALEGRKALSMAIKPVIDVIANSDHFERAIVEDADLPSEKLKKQATFLFKSYIGHPYVKELIEAYTKPEKPLYQRLSNATELPLRFYQTKSVEEAPFWDRYSELKDLNEQYKLIEKTNPDKALELLNENEDKINEFNLMKAYLDFQYQQIEGGEEPTGIKDYLNEQEGEKARKYEQSEDAPTTTLGKAGLYAQSGLTNPVDTFNAVRTGQPLRKMRGDATIVEREIASTDKDKNTQKDHRIPLWAGGDNSDKNTYYISTEDHKRKTQYENGLRKKLESNLMTKSQVQDALKKWHVDNNIRSLMPPIKNPKIKNVKPEAEDGYTYVDEKGTEKTIDLAFEPQSPMLTGNKELDKKLTAKYKGEITKKKNDILALYEQGVLTAEEAEKELAKWETKSKKSGRKKAKKAPKVKVRQVSAPSFAGINPIKLSSMVQAQPQQPRVNLQGLKLRVNKPQLRLDPRIRAGL